MKRIPFLVLIFCAMTARLNAYIEVPYTLGRVVNESTNIVLMKVEKVNKERKLIYYTKVADIKGKHQGDAIKHIITNGFHAREPKFIMDYAEPGKLAIFFYNGGASETCIGDYWYQSYNQGEWWGMSHSEPFLARSFSGSVEKLKVVVTDMLAGKEVVVPCAQFDPAKTDYYKNLLHEKKCPLWRMKASLKLVDYDAMLREKNKYVVGLGALGPEAVPGFIADLKKAEVETRLKAAVELGQIGDDAKMALPALGEALKDADAEVRIRSAEALVRIDPKNETGVPVLITAMKDDKFRALTIDILGGLGAPAKPAVPSLVAALKDKRTPVQLRAADALLRIEPNSGDAINALIGLVDVPAGTKIGWAVVEPADLKSTGGATLTSKEDKSILVGGPNPAKDTYTMTLRTDRRTITALRLELLPDPSLPANGPGRAPNGNIVLTRLALAKAEDGAKPVKWASASANHSQQGFDIGNVAAENGTGWALHPEFGKAHTAVFVLETPIVGNDTGTVLSLSIECQSPHVQHQIGRFRLSVTDADEPLLNPRVRGAEMLGGIGAPAKAAIPTLLKVMLDPDVSLRQASITALAQMAPDSIPVLAGALKDSKPEVRYSAVEALTQAGGHAARAMPALIEAWKEGDKGLRLRVGDLLIRFEGGAAPAAAALVASLSEPDRDIRLKAMQVLGRCGGPARAPAVPVLMQILAKDPDKELRAHSAWVLGQMGPQAREAVTVLMEALKDKERDVRLLSLESLGRVGNNKDPKAIADVAKVLLDDSDRDIRIRAADLYGRSNPFGGGPTVELFEDNHNLLLAQLIHDGGQATGETNDKFSGSASVKVMPQQRYNPTISGWAFPIVEKPELGQYRYIRFAWKKVGGNGIMIQLHTNTRSWENRYCSGKNVVGWGAIQVDPNPPGEWTVVTRDLFKDFGGAFTLHGMALTAMDGNGAYFDHIYLGRTIEELDKITEAKKNK